MSREIHHFCQSVRGALRNWDRRMMKRMASAFIMDDGRHLQTADEVREFLMDCLAKGWEVLPMGDCEGFDFKTGCPGHTQPDENQEESRDEHARG
jgi:hypothetical protein